MSEFDSGGEPVKKRHSADLPGGYCSLCLGHSHRTENCPNTKKEVEVPVTTCPCHPTPTSPDPLASIAESLEDLTVSLMEALSDISDQLKPVGQFFRHLDNGEVYLKADVEHLQDYQVLKGYRITITEGEGTE